MPKKILSRDESLEFLNKALYGRLATCGVDNQPYITPVNFVLDGGNIFFHCGIKGKKLDNIAWNPKACFEVSEPVKFYISTKPCNFSYRYWSVLAFGKAEAVEQPNEKVRIMELLIKKYAPNIEYFICDDDLKRVNIIKINVEAVTGKINVDPE